MGHGRRRSLPPTRGTFYAHPRLSKSSETALAARAAGAAPFRFNTVSSRRLEARPAHSFAPFQREAAAAGRPHALGVRDEQLRGAVSVGLTRHGRVCGVAYRLVPAAAVGAWSVAFESGGTPRALEGNDNSSFCVQLSTHRSEFGYAWKCIWN